MRLTNVKTLITLSTSSSNETVMISTPHNGPEAHQRDDTWSRLLERVGQARDEQAFAQLFAHFAPLIKGFCLGNLNSSFPADAAEEVVQLSLIHI